MSKLDSYTYDVIIIGAGISGLVCACYLAKAGMKVLIAEQHFKPGGYCTSFRRGGFTFDAAAHSFGGYKFGYLGKVFEDLGINKKVKIHKFNPSNIISTPDYKVSFWADISQTIAGFQSAFPEEADGIQRFFNFLIKPDPMAFARIRSWTFEDLLSEYFMSEKLKATLSFPLFGNGALPPSLMSAFIGAKIFQEFLLDGGYYPEGGMQALSDALAARCREFGCVIRLSTTVKKIRVKNNEVKGVTLEKEGFISSRYVVSNCDARQTFLKLIDRKIIDQDFSTEIMSMVPSLSTFIVYLGVKNSEDFFPDPGTNHWYLSEYNLFNIYRSTKEGDFRDMGRYLVHISPNESTISAMINAPFKSKKYWDSMRNKLADNLIRSIEMHTIPALSKHIVYRETATPHTLYRYTLNYAGAAYGWESSPSQLAKPDFRKPSFIQGLYLTGHWTTQGLGIPGVTYLGYDTASMILRKKIIFPKNMVH
jgi:phytoene dehydrogenase-like protein